MAQNGATITEAPEDMRAAWVGGMENAAQAWAKGLDDIGLPGTSVLQTYMDNMRAVGAKPLRDWDKE